MSYPYILAILDAELDRLYRARTLLTSTTEPDSKPRKQKMQRVEVPAEVAIDAAVPATPPPVLAAEPAQPVVTHVVSKGRPVRRYQRRSTPVAKVSSLPASALSGVVPAGPVYVSAAQVRVAQAQKEAADAAQTDAANPAASEIPTAAMLTQRWLSSPGA